jgi:hypothetical protein
LTAFKIYGIIIKNKGYKNMLKDIQKMCEEKEVTLLYLVKFGSHLYGTDTPESDVDYKGIFLPSKEQCFLQNAPKSITYSTGKNDSKNTEDDVDIQLWSLQYFLQLLSKGEINALDLCFSFTYPEVIEHKMLPMDNIFDNHEKFFNINDCNSFVGYAVGQAKKYGIKGSRLGKIKEVFEFVKKQDYNEKVLTILDEINEKFYDKSYCFIKKINNIDSLVLCGKVHMGSIFIDELYRRLEKDYSEYGKRAELARQNEGLDFKALSHAVRSINQMNELIDTGKIQFPLKTKDTLLKIKLGETSFNEIEILISEGIDTIKKKLENFDKKTKDQEFINQTILNFYDF